LELVAFNATFYIMYQLTIHHSCQSVYVSHSVCRGILNRCLWWQRPKIILCRISHLSECEYSPSAGDSWKRTRSSDTLSSHTAKSQEAFFGFFNWEDEEDTHS